MKWLTTLFDNKSVIKTPEYKGFSDFLLHAPQEKKIEVFTEAARRASEDQKKTLKRAGVSF